MKWIFTIRQKTKAALILSGVFIFILGKSWIDKKNVSELGDFFSSVYEDRLLAESYIYKLSDQLYQKKMLVNTCGLESSEQVQTRINQYNHAIANVIGDYEKTKFTKEEDCAFQDLKSSVASIKALEEKLFISRSLGQNEAETRNLMNQHYARVSTHLHQLSRIQVAEAKILNENSKKLIAGSVILDHFEIALLFGLALIIQALVFASESILTKVPHKPSLN